MTITLATPDEHVKIIATYMRPSPQSNPTARAEWSQLTDYAVRLGIKKNTVLIMGDLNASLNTRHTRRFTARSKKVQEHLLTSLQTAGRLVDIFPRLHPETHCCTWWNTRTWSSPDHALLRARPWTALRSTQHH
jgi:exonuclease III